MLPTPLEALIQIAQSLEVGIKEPLSGFQNL